MRTYQVTLWAGYQTVYTVAAPSIERAIMAVKENNSREFADRYSDCYITEIKVVDGEVLFCGEDK